MDGGWGNDTYVVDEAGDVVEDVEGRDTVKASFDFTLPDEIEVLVLTGPARQGTGNASDNIL
jgi:hypothetical protein